MNRNSIGEPLRLRRLINLTLGPDLDNTSVGNVQIIRHPYILLQLFDASR